MKHLNLLFYSLIIGVVCFWSCSQEEVLRDFTQEKVPNQQSTHVSNGMLVFPNDSIFAQTLNRVSGMSEVEYAKFLNSYGISTFKSIFDEVVKAEWEISDYYEEQAAQGLEVPQEPVLSQAYKNALENGIIQVINENGEEYFDYNIFEVNIAPIITNTGMVQIGDKIYQFGKENKKIIENGDINLIKDLDKVEFTQENITVVHYFPKSNSGARLYGTHEWLYANKADNGWLQDGNRRYRFYLYGSSYVDDTYDQRLYVTNVLRLEGQKKNFWGNWKYNESYSTNGNVITSYVYGLDGYENYLEDLPLSTSVPPTNASPFSWQYPNSGYNYGVNNAYFNLAPHIGGYYIFPPVYDCGLGALCGELTDGVRLDYVNGWCYLNSKYMTLSYVVTNN